MKFFLFYLEHGRVQNDGNSAHMLLLFVASALLLRQEHPARDNYLPYQDIGNESGQFTGL